MAAGNGDPSLCIFGAQVTPNQHALAREFVLLDNFYAEAEVSADGHEWSMAAYATDFVEKSWPLNYGNKSHNRIPYPSEGKFRIAAPSAGYIWDRCAQAGVSYRSFGEFVERSKAGELFATVDTLKDHFDPQYEPFNLGYSDLKRADRFISELQRFETEGELPRFQVVRLPNNHTEGTRVGKPTPTAMVAENDLALGRIVEAITHSNFWPRTAIFVVEDDAQNGSDHVDAHRTTAFVISPYARRGVIDSTLYSTTSMLRTMELILGLEPLSQFDAAARPMYASFQAKPDLRPYRCRPATTDLNAKNGATAWGADLSEQLDLSKEDAADDLLFNDIIWRSVRGPDAPMPPPVRAGFVFGRAGLDDDDDD
jgi:phospholipase C